jgi:phage shock protein E
MNRFFRQAKKVKEWNRMANRNNGRLVVWFSIAALLVMSMVGCGAAPAQTVIDHPSPDQVYERLEQGDDFILLDVRTPEEWAESHIDGATLLPLQELEARAAGELPKDADIVVYCRSGNRSAQAAEYLAGAGYSHISDMGGIQDWQAAGLPVVSGP